MSVKTLLTISFLVALTSAHIITTSDYKLGGKTFVYLTRFVFSDLITNGTIDELRDAYISLNLTFQAHSDEELSTLFILESNHEELNTFITEIREGEVWANLDTLVDVREVLYTYFPEAVFIEEIELDPTSPEGSAFSLEHRLEKAFRVRREDVYYTVLFYFLNEDNANLTAKQIMPHLLGEDDLYVNISGTIELKNSFGYLNAELYPLLGYFAWTGMVYTIIGAVWMGFIVKHFDQVISLHYFISFIYILCFFECFIMYFEYNFLNNRGYRNQTFLIMNLLFSASRNTLARVLMLAVSLGQGITTPSISQYHSQIAVISFLYFVSNIAYMGVLFLSNHQKISISLSLVVSVPIAVTNGIFFYWILAALDRTILFLKEQNQTLKFSLMKKIIIAMYTLVVLAVGVTLAMIIARVKVDRDDNWRLEWMFSVPYFTLFTLFLVWIMVILRPSYRSKMLATLEQLRESVVSEQNQGGNTSIEMQTPKENRERNINGAQQVQYDVYENYDSNRDDVEHKAEGKPQSSPNQIEVLDDREETKVEHEEQEDDEYEEEDEEEAKYEEVKEQRISI